MKTLTISILIILNFFALSLACADCYRCANPCSTCNASSYQRSDDCEFTGPCACSDPGCGKNPCLSKRRCCEAFGNMGALREDY